MLFHRMQYTIAVFSNNENSLAREEFLNKKDAEKRLRRAIALNPIIKLADIAGLNALRDKLIAMKSKVATVAYESLNRLLQFIIIGIIILFIYFLIG